MASETMQQRDPGDECDAAACSCGRMYQLNADGSTTLIAEDIWEALDLPSSAVQPEERLAASQQEGPRS